MKARVNSITAAVALGLLAGCNDNDSTGTGPIAGGGDTDISRVVSVVTDTDTTLANDLRGLSYASDGRIYASGYTDADADDRQTVVARFDANGNPDQTFGGGDGFVTLNIAPAGGEGASGNEDSLAVVELDNGDVIVAVNAADGNGDADTTEGTSAYLVRLDSGGNLVTTWGNGGVAEVVFGWPSASDQELANGAFPFDNISDMQLDASGGEERLVVFGVGTAAQVQGGATQRTDRDRYVTRVLASTGAADADFNGGTAFTYTTPGELNDNGRRGLVEADGAIMSAGYTNLGAGLGNHVILIRLLADGTVDPDFGDFIVPAGNVTGVEAPGVAVFNPFHGDDGFAEAYGAERQSDGGYVTTGYGAATGNGVVSSLGYQTTTAPDVVTFRVFAGTDGLDQTYGNPDAPGTQAIQSEGEGRPSEEERGRDMVVLDDDSTVHVGRFAGTAAVYFLTPDGQLDDRISDDGILELDHPTIGQQFFAVARSPVADRLAITTSGDDAGARLVVLGITDE